MSFKKLKPKDLLFFGSRATFLPLVSHKMKTDGPPKQVWPEGQLSLSIGAGLHANLTLAKSGEGVDTSLANAKRLPRPRKNVAEARV